MKDSTKETTTTTTMMTKDIWIKNASGGSLKIGKDETGHPLVKMGVNGCTVIDENLLTTNRDFKRAYAAGLVTIISAEEAQVIEVKAKSKPSVLSPYEDPFRDMTKADVKKKLDEIEDLDELENLMGRAERDEIADLIDDRIDEIETKNFVN